MSKALMEPVDYLLLGHVTADKVSDGRVLGGTVSYSAPVAALFGHRVGIVTSAAIAEPLIEPLSDVADLHIVAADHTTTFENIYNAQQRTQYVHKLAESLTYEDIPVAWRTAPLLHLAPLVNEVDLAIAARFPDSTVMLTLQGLLRQWDDSGLVTFKRWLDATALEHIDLVVFSKQDIREAPELEQEFAGVTRQLIVTDGERGGTYYYHGDAHPYSAFAVEEVDPTGAGDVFAAATLASLIATNNNIDLAIRIGARLAALTVTVKGARPAFTRSDIQKILKEVIEND